MERPAALASRFTPLSIQSVDLLELQRRGGATRPRNQHPCPVNPNQRNPKRSGATSRQRVPPKPIQTESEYNLPPRYNLGAVVRRTPENTPPSFEPSSLPPLPYLPSSLPPSSIDLTDTHPGATTPSGRGVPRDGHGGATAHARLLAVQAGGEGREGGQQVDRARGNIVRTHQSE